MEKIIMLSQSSFAKGIVLSLIVMAILTVMPLPVHATSSVTPSTTGATVSNESCVDIWAGRFDITCIWRGAMTYIGTAFISFGIAILDLASILFDLLVRYVVVGFKGSLDFLGMTEGIERGWTAMRDFINILIIGMFVFIAISIILGIKEYGQKKLVANVLIVAMLLNFSLLFTRIVIDVSNFMASRIYSSITATMPTGDKTVSEAFLRAMKTTSVANSKDTIARMAAQAQSGWIALLYGLIGMILLLAVAAVLLYGSFLMAARGLLLIFLMVSAPLAFATYLIPKLAQSDYGFYNWWKTLLNTAIFAPLLMLSLAISLYIVQSASPKGGASTLGSLVSNPGTLAQGNAWAVLWVYALGTGLLYLSIRLSSKFAGSISGFNIAQKFTAAPGALVAGAVAAPLLQRFIGGAALKRVGALQGGVRDANLNATLQTSKAATYERRADLAAERGDHGAAAAHRLTAQAAKNASLASQKSAAHQLEEAAKKKVLADRKFNLMDTSGAKAFNKSIGNTGILSGESAKGAKGYASQVEEKAKHAAQMAEGAKPGDAQKAAIKEEAKEQARTQHGVNMEDRRIQKELTQASRDAAQATRDGAKTAHEDAAARADAERDNNRSFIESKRNLVNAEAEKAERERIYNDNVNELMTRIIAANDPAEKQRLRDELTQAEAAHQADIAPYNQRINDAQREKALVEDELKRSENGQRAEQFRTALAQAEQDFATKTTKFNAAVTAERAGEKLVNELAKNLEAGVVKSAGEIAYAIGESEGGIMKGNLLSKKAIAEEARSQYSKRQGNASQLREILKNSGVSDADTPPAPPAGGGAAPPAAH